VISYTSYRYLYPPRAENAIPPSALAEHEKDCLAMPKLNGGCTEIYTDGKQVIVTNRHKKEKSNLQISRLEALSLHRGKGWMIITGENMEKSKLGSDGKPFGGFVIWGIIALDGYQLVGKTVEERISLLDQLYGKADSREKWLYGASENVYRAKSYEKNFLKIYKEVTVVQMYEGLVLYTKGIGLENGIKAMNNVGSILKCRAVRDGEKLNYNF